MKNSILLSCLILTACNTVKYKHTRIGTNDQVLITYKRFFWKTGTLEGSYTNGPLRANIKVGPSGPDNQTIEALMRGAMEGAVKGAK